MRRTADASTSSKLFSPSTRETGPAGIIPNYVPKLIEVNDSNENVFQAPYMVMEWPAGDSLASNWKHVAKARKESRLDKLLMLIARLRIFSSKLSRITTERGQVKESHMNDRYTVPVEQDAPKTSNSIQKRNGIPQSGSSAAATIRLKGLPKGVRSSAWPKSVWPSHWPDVSRWG